MRYRVPERVAWVDAEDLGQGESLYLVVVPGGLPVVLEGTARLIWHVAAGGGEVLPEVAELVGKPAGEIERDVETFVGDMVRRGLLAPAEEGAG